MRIQSVTWLPPSSAPAPPLAFPSKMCTNTSCGQGFSSAASEIKQIPAGSGMGAAPGVRQHQSRPGSRRVGKHRRLHTPLCAARDEGSCHRPPQQHRVAREGSCWPGDLDVTQTIVPLDGLWGIKPCTPEPCAWHARVSDRRKI